MPLMFSKGLPRGTIAPAFDLPGVDGRRYSLRSFEDAGVLVVIFTCNHCPYAKAYEERFVALQRDYGARGVRLVAVNSNDAQAFPDDSFAKMRVRSDEKGFNFPYLHDEDQSVARAYQAVCTPDIYVFDAQRRLICNTRVDDSWEDPARVTRHDLREILDAVLESRTPSFDPEPSKGCSIKWKAT